MEPATYNFTVWQGSLFTRVLTWKDANGTAINLTGYTARLQARNSADSSKLLVDLGSDDITLGGLAGTITINITADISSAWTFDSAIYNLELIPASGENNAQRLLTGTITLNKEVAR